MSSFSKEKKDNYNVVDVYQSLLISFLSLIQPESISKLIFEKKREKKRTEMMHAIQVGWNVWETHPIAMR